MSLPRSCPSLILILAFALFGCATTQAFAKDDDREKIINSYVKYVVRHYGDAIAGKEMLEKKNGLTCLKCHAVDGEEKMAPNLRGIADKFSRADLVRHIIDPSFTIRPGFETTNFVMADGRVLSGNLRKVSNEGYTIWDAEGKTVTIAKDQVEEQSVSTTSLMPDDLIKEISREQLTDLVAFIESLRTTRRKGLSARDTEVEIPSLSQPVKFIQFHDKEINFERPVWFEAIPGQKNQFVILEHQTAKVWRLVKSDDGDRKELFLDLKSEVSKGPNEGLMSIAFHPDYVSNGRYFLKHESRDTGKLQTFVIERRATEDRLSDSGATSRRLFHVDQPAGNHNGGCIQFGPDGYLYIAFGDGGPQKDPNGHGQSLYDFLGSMLRIDVDSKTDGLPYGIPADNPFNELALDDDKIRTELWATGFREPWRFSFDSVTGDLWVGDVGQVDFEEVAIVRRGENHGWNVIEGYDPFSDEYKRDGVVFTPPVFAYSHSLGASVTGGHVYRGSLYPQFHGMYVFGDFESRRVWGIQCSDRKLVSVMELGRSPCAMSSFGIDHEGELYLVGFDGNIYKIEFNNEF